MNKEYMGDSVYVQEDPAITDGVVLTTENGDGASNIISMEPQVINNFLFYLKKIGYNTNV